MKSAEATAKPSLPKYWVFRITEALPIPYWQTCCLYSCVFFAVLLSALIATGADFSNKTYIRGLVLMPLLAGYITALGPMVSNSANRMIERLEYCLKPGAPVDRFKTETYTLNAKTFWTWTIIFQTISLALQLLGSERENSSDWVIFFARQFLFLHYTFYAFLFVKILQISGFLDKWVVASVYKSADLAAVGRLGMSLAGLVTIALAFVGVIQIALEAPVGVLVMVVIMSLPGYVLVAFTLYRPARVVQRKIRAAKEAEKRRIADAIHDKSTLLVLGENLGGTDLMDYKKRIYYMREWPFDFTTIRAFGGFLLFPFFSWTCAAIITVFVRKALM
ncbi:hypothetical protein [Primorskyibacter sp. S187A]|uniref:hypothetical protein n=1 Tax=Primorskyibacter sp. S187A TaxID=3415130 RepID=UPI003C7A7049